MFDIPSMFLVVAVFSVFNFLFLIAVYFFSIRESFYRYWVYTLIFGIVTLVFRSFGSKAFNFIYPFQVIPFLLQLHFLFKTFFTILNIKVSDKSRYLEYCLLIITGMVSLYFGSSAPFLSLVAFVAYLSLFYIVFNHLCFQKSQRSSSFIIYIFLSLGLFIQLLGWTGLFINSLAEVKLLDFTILSRDIIILTFLIPGNWVVGFSMILLIYTHSSDKLKESSFLGFSDIIQRKILIINQKLLTSIGKNIDDLQLMLPTSRNIIIGEKGSSVFLKAAGTKFQQTSMGIKVSRLFSKVEKKVYRTSAGELEKIVPFLWPQWQEDFFQAVFIHVPIIPLSFHGFIILMYSFFEYMPPMEDRALSEGIIVTIEKRLDKSSGVDISVLYPDQVSPLFAEEASWLSYFIEKVLEGRVFIDTSGGLIKVSFDLK